MTGKGMTIGNYAAVRLRRDRVSSRLAPERLANSGFGILAFSVENGSSIRGGDDARDTGYSLYSYTRVC